MSEVDDVCRGLRDCLQGYLKQEVMLRMQVVLMLGATLTALPVLYNVSIPVSTLSLVANVLNRRHDFENTFSVVATALAMEHFLGKLY